MLFARIRNLRPVAVAYFLIVGVAIEVTATRAIHPTLGRLWDAVATAGALAVVTVPFVAPSRLRAVLTGVAAFVILIHALEWLRLTDASPVGVSVAFLWVSALVGVVLQVAADQDLDVKAKLADPTPPTS